MPRQSVGIRVGVYAANFTHGDRHADARDDMENLLSLRGSEATKQTPGRVNYRKFYPLSALRATSPEGGSKKYVILSGSEISHDQSE